MLFHSFCKLTYDKASSQEGNLQQDTPADNADVHSLKHTYD